MSMLNGLIGQERLQTLASQAPTKVVSAIQKASLKTGIDFAYLMEKANAESSFKADAKAKTSSASGLYQFIESTWLKTVKDHGAEFGMGDYAAQIDDNGKVSNPALRREILALRNDPEKAAYMAAAFTADNKAYLEQTLGSDAEIGATELYFTHFMGAKGGGDFLKAYSENPDQSGAALFPKAAQANRGVFYDKGGQPRSLGEIYDFFAAKFAASETSAAAEPDTRVPQTVPLANGSLFRTSRPVEISADTAQNIIQTYQPAVWDFITHPALRFLQQQQPSQQQDEDQSSRLSIPQGQLGRAALSGATMQGLLSML